MPREVKWAIAFLAGAALLWFGWRFYIALVILHVIVCLVLIGVILLQSGQAADIAGAFGGSGSQTAFGPRGAATVLSRATTWCAVMFMVCALALVLHTDKGVGQGGSVLEKFSKPAPKPTPVTPAKPQTATPQSSTPQSSTPQSNAPTSSAPAPA